MTESKIITPAKTHAPSFAEALREGLYSTPEPESVIRRIETDFDGWLNDEFDLAIPVELEDGSKVSRVPHTALWLVRGDRFIAAASLRHELTENLKRVGGHLGFSVRASERRRGYGSLLVKLALPHAKALGLEKILVTCDDANAGSARVIENAGGVLHDITEVPGRNGPHRRYWITL